MKSFKVGLLFIPLIFGSFIYIIFRSERLLMFRWFEFLHINSIIQKTRTIGSEYIFPDWFIYNLPDGLWISSYVLISIEIWNREITRQNIFWISIIPVVAMASEILQYFGIFRGTFDALDILFYILGAFTPFIFHNLNYNKFYEKF